MSKWNLLQKPSLFDPQKKRDLQVVVVESSRFVLISETVFLEVQVQETLIAGDQSSLAKFLLQ